MQSFLLPEEVATRHRRDDDNAVPGPVLVARRDAPPQSAATDLGNVVPFVRLRRTGEAPALPLPEIDPLARPVLPRAGAVVGRTALLVAASLTLHGAVLAMFWQSPKPMASIGIEAMTIEITLGAATAAGLASQPGEQEVQVPLTAQEQVQEKPREEARLTTPMPQEVPVTGRDSAPPPDPLEDPRPEVQAAEPAPAEPRDAPATEIQPPQPPPQPVETAPERTRTAAPTDTTAQQQRQVAATPPSDSASGIGRGRSDDSANYNGRVAAHLQRYRQYPAAARSAGAQGVATVSFSIDGNGRVTSARLANGSGNAVIDQEVVAMVRRASPFPRPPDGQTRNFTVPVRFNLR